MTNQPGNYEFYPIGQISIALDDAYEYIANIPSPINDALRKDIERNLTLFNPRMLFSSFIRFS